LKINALAGVLGNNYTHTHTLSQHPACKSAGVKNFTALLLLLSSKAATAIYSFACMCLSLCSDRWQNRFAGGGGIQTFAALLFLSQSVLVYHFHTALQLRVNNNSSFTCVPRTKSSYTNYAESSLSAPGRTLDTNMYRRTTGFASSEGCKQSCLSQALSRGQQIATLTSSTLS
jgi:hypothetical protein